MTPARGEVWLFDLGMAEKVRPASIGSVLYGDYDRAVPFLRPGAFLVQDVATYTNIRPEAWRPEPELFDAVFAGLLGWLGHSLQVKLTNRYTSASRITCP